MFTPRFLTMISCVIFSITASGRGNESPVFPFVGRYCVSCHNTEEASGDLNIQALRLAGNGSFEAHREAWERILSKLETAEMPPEKAKRPQSQEALRITKWLEAEFARQDRLIEPRPGRIAARRLNRVEYANSIRDLLGVELPTDVDFPPDQAAFGFDNIADALRLSPVLLEKYLTAGERVVRTAIYGPQERKPAITHYPLPVRINLSRGTKALPHDLHNYDLSGLSLVSSAHVTHTFPVDGEYSFRIVLNGHRPNQSEPAHPALFIDGVLAREFEIDATDLEGQFVETRLDVEAGEHLLSVSYLKTFHGLPPQYNGPYPSLRPPGSLLSNNGRGKLTQKDIELLRKLGTKIKTDSVETRVDNRFESIDVGGPFRQPAGPSAESRKRIFVCGHEYGRHTDDCTRTVLSSFARRAFRRPVTDEELANLEQLVALVREQGDPWEEGIATALQAILVSPHFLFRIEGGKAERNTRESMSPVTDLELASRLSYFLWSSTPDDELLQLAETGRLRQTGVLHEQVRRMLKSKKARALVENFAGQWLQFNNMDVVRPDVRTFPEFEDSLRRSMRRETERFLEEIVRNDRSVLEIIDADYTFVDERLARFYGLPGIDGPEFRKVDMRNTRRGGGVLSHASILTVSSYATRTSPVLRGKWILEALLNSPPPPPPPSVPALDEEKAALSGSIREQLEAHRENVACAACHARLDPLGFGLENFDAIGAWRENAGSEPVDASGTLPSGESFRGPEQLKRILLTQREAFVDGLAEKLLIYALGRGLERYDRPALAKITSQLSKADNRFSALVLGIVHSLPFQMRGTETSRPEPSAETETTP